MQAATLAGKTIFITGASRGIGKAVALKCAKDGANIVIAAKTTNPHPKLPGTIYSTAKEIEEAGGKCLPQECDIRNEEHVARAVEETVKTFGGIDILVNNASAISLTGTKQTSMKKFDLMFGVNVRGTFLCSKYCAEHLKKAKNPHILNMSPPLNLNPVWFSSHVAYTMAKYGMSMCALGMADEFKDDGIAVNCLWPRTAIYTAAMEMLGGDNIAPECRKPEIMADAAYFILTKDSRSYSGNFAIDDEVLRENGVQDIDSYSCVPGSKLMPDFFLDISEETYVHNDADTNVDTILQTIENKFRENPSLVQNIQGSFQFNVSGDGSNETWFLNLKDSPPAFSKNSGKIPDCSLSLSSGDFKRLFTGQLNPTEAFMAGKLKISGDMSLSLKLESIMKQLSSKL